jgi:hypothetical protein
LPEEHAFGRNAAAGCSDQAMPIPVFRIAAALSILWLIQPEILRAPIRAAASGLMHVAGEQKNPELLIRAACANMPEHCTRMALDLLKEKQAAARPTGTVPKQKDP